MTVSTTSIKAGPYSGNDVATAFAYTWRVESKTEVIVYETDDSDVVTTLTVDTDYTVSNIGVDGGGDITRVAGALPTGYTWLIASNFAETQETDFESQGAFLPAVHEAAFDKLTHLIQQVVETQTRSVSLAPNLTGIDVTLPTPIAGNLLGWKNPATGLINVSPGSLTYGARTVETVAEMDAATLTVGMFVQTAGYYAAGDGGGNIYEIVAAGTGTDDGGSYIDLSGSGLQAKGLFEDGRINVKQYGLKGDAATDDTAALQNAMAIGEPLFWPDGTYMITNLAITTDQNWLTQSATIKRTTTATAGNWITVTASKFTMIGFTLNGNKAGNTNACSNITISSGCSFSHFERVTSKNAKVNGGYGSGFVFAPGNDGSDSHVVINSEAVSNESHGLSASYVTNLKVIGGRYQYNSGAGISFNNYDVTLTHKIADSHVIGATVIGNSSSGIVIGNFIEDNVQTVPRTYGPDNPVTARCSVSDCFVSENSGYGVAASGDNSLISDNTIISNGDGGTAFGGVLFNARYSRLSGNTISSNDSFGCDAGGSQNSVISDNSFLFNGSTVGAPGLNLEASLNITVTGNYFLSNNITTGQQLHVRRVGGDGAGSNFSVETNYITLRDNTFSMGSSNIGIKVFNGVKGVSITHNHFIGGNVSNMIQAIAYLPVIRHNTHDNSSTYEGVLGGSGELLYPDVLDHLYTNLTGTVEGIQTYTHGAVVGPTGIGWLDVTAAGTGYTSAPTVSFSGGGGSGASATAIVAGGAVIGFRMNTFGTGYTSAPTVTLTGGGGTGATATATVGVPIARDKQLSIHFNSAATVKRSGTYPGSRVESPSLSDLTVPSHGMITLRGKFSEWRLESKNF